MQTRIYYLYNENDGSQNGSIESTHRVSFSTDIKPKLNQYFDFNTMAWEDPSADSVNIDDHNEKERLEAISFRASEIIYGIYPIIKQLNIGNLIEPYTQEDKDTMISFISKIKNIAKEAEKNKTLLSDINWELE